MKYNLAAIAIAAASLVATAVAPVSEGTGVMSANTKTCSAGFTHAIIKGGEQCLRRGRPCAHTAHGSPYTRYGYRCVRRGAHGRYHLS
jgi:hypothetical protein